MPSEDYQKLKSGEYTTGNFINDRFAVFDEKEDENILKNSHYFQNNQRYKISIGLINKNTNDYEKDKIDKHVFWLDYKLMVLKLVLNDSLSNIGTTGYIDIHNTGSYADVFLHRHNSFYVVINITIVGHDNVNIKLEPYIFDISSVENLSSPTEEQNRVLRLNLIDILTSIFNNHSIATVIKMSGGSLVQKSSYKEVFEDILNYAKSHIKNNFFGKYEYRKDLYFTDGMEISTDYRKAEEDEEEGDNCDLTELVRASFAKIPQNATIMEAIRVLQQDCGRPLKTSKTFSNTSQTAGDLIIPFFFKEEYQYYVPHYSMIWKDQEKSTMENVKDAVSGIIGGKLSEASKVSSEFESATKNRRMMYNPNYGGKETMILYRNMTMRDIYMPFYLAFVDKETSSEKSTEKYIFESINPSRNKDNSYTDEELEFNVIPGYRRNCVVHALQSFPYNAEVVKKKWKNIVFVDTKNSTSSVLIFLRWFYNYFSTVFLNNNLANGIKYLPNVLPSFLAKSATYKVGEAKEEGETFDTLYDMHNSNIFICRTGDSRNEALREMGKNIASFILSNNRYVLKLDGDLFRRPNEIIKFTQFSSGSSIFSKLNSMITGGVNIGGDPNTLLYVTNVAHVFSEEGYYNYVEGCKFCENVKFKLPKIDFMK